MAESSQIHRLGPVQSRPSWECTGRQTLRAHSWGLVSSPQRRSARLEKVRAESGNELNFASLCAWPWRPRISWEHCRPGSSHSSGADLKGDLRTASLESILFLWSLASFTEHFQCGAGFSHDACRVPRIPTQGCAWYCLCFLGVRGQGVAFLNA